MSTTIITLLITLSISVIGHTLTIYYAQRPRFVVIASECYLEFKTWHKAQQYIKEEPLEDYQVFIFEKNEYTFITSSER